MKAILEFNLPEETEEYEIANSAGRAMGALEDIGNYLRGFKHRTLSAKEALLFDEIRNKFYEIVTDALPDRDF